VELIKEVADHQLDGAFVTGPIKHPVLKQYMYLPKTRNSLLLFTNFLKDNKKLFNFQLNSFS